MGHRRGGVLEHHVAGCLRPANGLVKRFKGDPTTAVMALRDQIEEDNQGYRESIIDFRMVADDYLTEFEQSQLDYEGKITYAAKELAW